MESTIGVIDKIYASVDNKDIRDNTKLPAPHLYKVNDYIGYGMEPKIGGRIYLILYLFGNVLFQLMVKLWT
ncbi:MAG: hypothetical protein PUA97_04760 [bacterium]|nr:hypothetical protein [bacterium]